MKNLVSRFRKKRVRLSDRVRDGLRCSVDGKSVMMAQKLFQKLAEGNQIVVETPYAINIGCGDGMQFEDPVYPLYRAGFTGVAIDAFNHRDLHTNLGDLDVTLMPDTFVSAQNIVDILEETGCPPNPAFLKVDVDGIDASILRAVLKGGFRPMAIQAEVNTEIPPPYSFSICPSEAYRPGSEHGFFGFSLSYGVDLLMSFGYRLVALDFETGWTHDGLWVHESILSTGSVIALDPYEEFRKRPAFLYHIEATSKEMLRSWRTRNDRDNVRNEIWQTMLRCSTLKLGHTDVPFELYISD